MNKYFTVSYYRYNKAEADKLIASDLEFLSFFGDRNGTLSKSDRKSIEVRFLRFFRKAQVNKGNIWGKIYGKLTRLMTKKYGMDFGGCPNFGEGIIIGHWGRIVINPDTKFGNHVFLTHNVTIGRDVRGKRIGVPTIGNRVCIRTNSCVVGNITIGDDVLIAPNTFVNFDVPSHSIVIGNPASVHHRENATEGHII